MNTLTNSPAGGDRLIDRRDPIDPDPAGKGLSSGAGRAARAATEALLAERIEPGYWRAERPSLTSFQADAVLLELWMDPPSGTWNPKNRATIERAAESILERQLPDGGFSDAIDPETSLGETVKAYCALKLAGLADDDPRMRATRDYVIEHGGLDAADDLTRIELSFFGLYPRNRCPLFPIEAMLLPGNAPDWLPAPVRAVVVPLALIQALRPSKPVPDRFDLAELLVPEPERITPSGPSGLLGDACRLYGRTSAMVPGSIRKRAIRAAERWVTEHLEPAGFPAAFHRPLLYSVLALDLLGRGPSDPLRAAAESRLRSVLSAELLGDPNDWPAPVWQTAFATRLIVAGREAPAVGLKHTADWLLGRRQIQHSPWSPTRPGIDPGGWSTGYSNGLYPDAVTTASVLLTLRETSASEGREQTAATGTAIRWLLAAQRADGGWPAFDADGGRGPFRNATLAGAGAEFSRSSAGVTGLVMEALCEGGLSERDPAIRRGIDYLAGIQQLDGSWRGSLGEGYLHTTARALRGLRTAGVDSHEPYVLRAGEWLRSIQNPDGGWGESAGAAGDGEYVPAPSQAPQTAWGVIGLLAGGDTGSGCVERGIKYLIAHQDADGAWTAKDGAEGGFPGALAFASGPDRSFVPLLALAAFREENLSRREDTA